MMKVVVKNLKKKKFVPPDPKWKVCFDLQKRISDKVESGELTISGSGHLTIDLADQRYFVLDRLRLHDLTMDELRDVEDVLTTGKGSVVVTKPYPQSCGKCPADFVKAI